MKRIVFVAFAVLFCGMASALPSGWTKPSGYAYTLSLYAQVKDADGNLIESTGSTLAVFDSNGICRGLKEVATNSRGVTLYQISVSSNAVSESGLKLKIYDAGTDKVYDIIETLDFSANAVIPESGGASHPQVFNVKPPLKLPENWVKPTGYAYTLSLYAQVKGTDGNLIQTEGSVLAVFDSNDVCRGLKEVATNSRGVTLYQISVSSNAVSENGLSLKICDAATEEVYDISETLDFTANAVIPESGGASHPQIFNVKPPYTLVHSINVAFSDGTSTALRFGADDALEDAYSPDKDVEAQTTKAFIVADDGNGGTVKLQEHYLKLSAVNRWRFSVVLEAGATATIGWDALLANGRHGYLFPKEGSTEAISMADNGSFVLRNNGKSKKTFSFGLTIAKDGLFVEYRFKNGWNLLSFSFVPTPADEASLLALKPMAFSGMSTYVRANSIEANVGYWFFTRYDNLQVLEKTETASSTNPPKGWSLWGTAIGGALPSGARAFEWHDRRFHEAEAIKTGGGYWIFRK